MKSASETCTRRPTWVEIDLNNLAFNLASARNFIGEGVRVMAVVKADAYGHDAVECSRRLEAEGIDWLGVALPEEGLALREAGIRVPILCLGSFWPGQEPMVLENDLTTVIFREEQAELLDRASASRGARAVVHVKVDTGMGRVGVRPEEVGDFAKRLKSFEHLKVDGLMTHFASADDPAEDKFTDRQIELFHRAVDVFRENGFDPTEIDMANSPGALLHPTSRGNLVRLGGILYGLGHDIIPATASQPEFRPVLSLHTRIAHIKRVTAGDTLGYGRTYTAARDSLIATIPIGYQDGFSRAISNRGRALLNNISVPVAGRVSMDWTMLDVSAVPSAAIGDQVTLIGGQTADRITAEEIASILGTISYEVTCDIDRRVTRRFVN